MKSLNNLLVGLGIALCAAGIFQAGLPLNSSAEAECYIGGTLTCSGTNESCPSQACVQPTGTPSYVCRTEPAGTGTVIDHKEKQYQSYDHYVESADGTGRTGLTTAVAKHCLYEFQCACTPVQHAEARSQAPLCADSQKAEDLHPSPTDGSVNIRKSDNSSSLCGG